MCVARTCVTTDGTRSNVGSSRVVRGWTVGAAAGEVCFLATAAATCRPLERQLRRTLFPAGGTQNAMCVPASDAVSFSLSLFSSYERAFKTNYYASTQKEKGE